MWRSASRIFDEYDGAGHGDGADATYDYGRGVHDAHVGSSHHHSAGCERSSDTNNDCDAQYHGGDVYYRHANT